MVGLITKNLSVLPADAALKIEETAEGVRVLRDVAVRTCLIERVAPVKAADENYLVEAIFRGSWGERLRPYLSDSDYAALLRLCDPGHPDFALRRPDFHFLQSFTLALGAI